MQGNCQVCECTKDELDDCEVHETRSKLDVSASINQAAFHGVFPQWQQEKGIGDPPAPRPLYQRAGLPPQLRYSKTRVAYAETRLGVKISTNPTWLFPHFDCYVQVHLFKISRNIALYVCIAFCLLTAFDVFVRADTG